MDQAAPPNWATVTCAACAVRQITVGDRWSEGLAKVWRKDYVCYPCAWELASIIKTHHSSLGLPLSK